MPRYNMGSRGPPSKYLIPVLLRIYTQHRTRKNVRVLQHICSGIHPVALEPVEDLKQLRLDEVDEDEVDGRVVREATGCICANEVGR